MSDEQFLTIPEPAKGWREWCDYACQAREDKAELQQQVRCLKRWAPSLEVYDDGPLPELKLMVSVATATIGFAPDVPALLKHIGDHVRREFHRYLMEHGHMRRHFNQPTEGNP